MYCQHGCSIVCKQRGELCIVNMAVLSEIRSSCMQIIGYSVAVLNNGGSRYLGLALFLVVGMSVQHLLDSYWSLEICAQEKQDCQSNYTELKNIHSSLDKENTKQSMKILEQYKTITDIQVKQLELEQKLKQLEKEN